MGFGAGAAVAGLHRYGSRYEISQIYNAQDRLTTLSRELTQAMYVNPPNQNLRVFLAAVMVYYDDAVLVEPQLLEKYDVVLPKLDRMIGK